MSQNAPVPLLSAPVPIGTVSLGVGIDTARYGHHVSFLDEQKRSAAKSFHFTESAAGDQQFQAILQKLAEKHPGVHFHIRLDAAGQYAENLVQWLHRLPFDTTIVERPAATPHNPPEFQQHRPVCQLGVELAGKVSDTGQTGSRQAGNIDQDSASRRGHGRDLAIGGRAIDRL